MQTRKPAINTQQGKLTPHFSFSILVSIINRVTGALLQGILPFKWKPIFRHPLDSIQEGQEID
jgi:hypothetical protein